jgi:prevent-host-death family protein
METIVGAFEAKTHLSELLDTVLRGDIIVITRRGKPVARLMPYEEGHNVQEAKNAVLEIRSLAKSISLTGTWDDSWKEFRDEGRR